MAGVDDGAVGRARTGQVARHGFDRLLRSGQADAHRRRGRQLRQAFQRQREVGAALVAGQGVDFIDDHAAHRAQHLPSGSRGEQDIEGFGGGDQNMRRAALHRLAFRLRRIAGAHLGADRHVGKAAVQQRRANAVQRQFQVLADVVGQSLERRDIQHPRLVRRRCFDEFPYELIDGGEKRRQGFSGTGGCDDERGPAGADRRPGAYLDFRRRAEM